MIDNRGACRANRFGDDWRRLRGGAGCVLAVAMALAGTTVAAQSPGGAAPPDDGTGASQNHHQHRRDLSNEQAKKPPLPEVKVTPEPWPRLDPGAVFCRTAEDLRQHLAFVSARLDGNTSGFAEPAGCRVIRAQTAVAVLGREGPGRTQVRMSNAPAETGWTDAFLPDKGSSK
jgi:hypothetical protein